MVNYELGKIYKIVSNETKLIYIGSTAQKYLSTRLEGHKKDYKKYLNGKYPYITSFTIIEGGNFDIILLENHSCKDKYELQARERHYIETMECVNKFIPNRTQKEYREDNKEKIKKYREDNKETLLKDKKQYYLSNKDKIKNYQEDNKETIKEYKRQYYLSNRQKINERRRQLREAKRVEKQQVITE